MNNELNVAEETKRRFDQMMNSDFGMHSSDLVHFQVHNFDNDHTYNVEITNRGKIRARCDCPDFMLRGRIYGIPCKHIQHVFYNLDWYESSSEELKK